MQNEYIKLSQEDFEENLCEFVLYSFGPMVLTMVVWSALLAWLCIPLQMLQQADATVVSVGSFAHQVRKWLQKYSVQDHSQERALGVSFSRPGHSLTVGLAVLFALEQRW